jgi:O-methyltransferase involved in polyketide biosynthesis
MTADSIPPGVNPEVPTPARLYDYFLGGSNHFEVDRQLGKRIQDLVPEVSDSAWANRAFHQRAAVWLARERGLDQFIDVGAGLPTQGNTHELVRSVVPDARVIYVDNDPMVLAHGGALLAGVPGVDIVLADLRDPEALLSDPVLTSQIDLSRPVGFLMSGVLYFVADEADPWGLVASYVRALAPGSYIVLSHLTSDNKPPRAVETGEAVYARATENIHFRTRAEFERFFEGLEMVPPYPGAPAAVSYVGVWGAEDPVAADTDDSRWLYCGVARRP